MQDLHNKCGKLYLTAPIKPQKIEDLEKVLEFGKRVKEANIKLPFPPFFLLVAGTGCRREIYPNGGCSFS